MRKREKMRENKKKRENEKKNRRHRIEVDLVISTWKEGGGEEEKNEARVGKKSKQKLRKVRKQCQSTRKSKHLEQKQR